MKAITCSQCGALIKRISLRDKFAHCDFCGAKILLEENKEKIVEISNRKADVEKTEEEKLTPWDQYRENYRKVQERADKLYVPDSDLPSKNYPFLAPLIILAIVGIPLIIFIINLESFNPKQNKLPQKTLVEKSETVKISNSTPLTTPYPQINYEVKVQWDGINDLEHFENPQIDMSKLSSFDEAELKKTVFKNRSVQVKVTIDPSGEVSAAKAISGHPILKEAAEEAAKKSLFNSRQKPSTRILIYYFRLKSE